MSTNSIKMIIGFANDLAIQNGLTARASRAGRVVKFGENDTFAYDIIEGQITEQYAKKIAQSIFDVFVKQDKTI